jgi:hypothetical protein
MIVDVCLEHSPIIQISIISYTIMYGSLPEAMCAYGYVMKTDENAT